MNLFTVPIILAARKHAMDSIRSKNGFDFESDDYKFPYGYGNQFYGTKKTSVFHFSPEVFRRKASNGASGLYLVNGGNIPSDMASSASYAAMPSGDKFQTIVCTLNRGTASKIEKISALNLSPNIIPTFPTRCNEDPYPLPEVNPEEGKNHKPNFMYLPMYQHSCSTHPRAEGLAHEDNYDCLKSTTGAGNAKGLCCQTVAGCIGGSKICTKSLDLQGKPAFVCQPIDGANLSFFDCNINGDQLEECGYKKSCDVGVNYSVGLRMWQCYNFSGECGCEEINGVTWYPFDCGKSRTFHISGNTDCGCTGQGGRVFVTGYTDCDYCVRASPGLGTKPVIKKCTDVSFGEQQYCECNFTLPFNLGGTFDDGYITSFIYPTYMFSNWMGLTLGNTGKVQSSSCGGEYHFDCTDIS